MIIFNEVIIQKNFVFASRIVSDFKRMTAEATFQTLRHFADVLSTTTPGFSYVITCIKFELFQSTSLSIWMPYLLPLMEDVKVDLHEISWHVKHLLALHLDILENLLLIRLARRKDFAVRPELQTVWDLEFGEPKWRGESVPLVVVNSFLQEQPGRWSEDTEGNLKPSSHALISTRYVNDTICTRV